MVRLRFNLGRGDNYKKWQLKTFDKNSKIQKVEHYDPSEVSILVLGGILKNSKATAEKIYAGKNKTVCAWVLADEVMVFNKDNTPIKVIEHVTKNKLSYNPRKAPFWRNEHGEDIDDTKYDYLLAQGRNLINLDYIVKKTFKGGKIPDLELMGYMLGDIRFMEKYKKTLTIN